MKNYCDLVSGAQAPMSFSKYKPYDLVFRSSGFGLMGSTHPHTHTHSIFLSLSHTLTHTHTQSQSHTKPRKIRWFELSQSFAAEFELFYCIFRPKLGLQVSLRIWSSFKVFLKLKENKTLSWRYWTFISFFYVLTCITSVQYLSITCNAFIACDLIMSFRKM